MCDFKILLTVFNQSYNCQMSHYLGRNRLPKPFLILPSLAHTLLALSFLGHSELLFTIMDFKVHEREKQFHFCYFGKRHWIQSSGVFHRSDEICTSPTLLQLYFEFCRHKEIRKQNFAFKFRFVCMQCAQLNQTAIPIPDQNSKSY